MYEQEADAGILYNIFIVFALEVVALVPSQYVCQFCSRTLTFVIHLLVFIIFDFPLVTPMGCCLDVGRFCILISWN